jgi:heme-degrading monooxygenase HmoA
MYARVITVQIQPIRVDEAIRIYQDSVVPAAKQQKGFKNIWLLTDRKSGKGISVVLWETEADMIASETSGYLSAQLAKFGSFFTIPPITERYEVSVQV